MELKRRGRERQPSLSWTSLLAQSRLTATGMKGGSVYFLDFEDCVPTE